LANVLNISIEQDYTAYKAYINKMYATLNVRRKATKPEAFKFTTSDDKLYLVKRKMFIFKKTWDAIKDVKMQGRKTAFWELYEATVKYTDYEDEVLATELLDKVFLRADRVKMLRDVEDTLWEVQYGKSNNNDNNKSDVDKTNMLLFGTESSYQKAFVKYVDIRENIASDEYINKVMNETRLCLYLIGREYEWRHGGKPVSVRFAGDVQSTLGDVCNPVTNALKIAIKDHLNELGRAGKLTVVFESKVKKEVVKREDGKDGNDCGDDSEDEDGECFEGKAVTLNKNSLPVSVAVTHHLVMDLLSKLLDTIARQNDVRRMVNYANTLLVTTFCMHEGSRPIEIIKTEKHRDLNFWLNGTQYPLLVLAFVKPETLSTLLESGELLRYTGDFWKGKKLQKYRMRIKSWIPLAYNSLDLAMIYIIVMRALACVDLDGMTNRVVNTDDQGKLTKKLREVVNEMGIQGLSWYSIRTGATEDDKVLGIPATWTRYRMGHTKTSLMMNRYANNLNQRVIVHDNQTILGCDVGGNGATDNSVLPLFFKKEEGAILRNGGSIPTHIYVELNTIKSALTDLLYGGGGKDSLRRMVDSGKLYVASDKKQLLKEFKTSITLGSEFIFMSKILPSSRMYMTNTEATRENVHGYFKEYTGTDTDRLVLWSYPQIMYGEFNGKLRDDAKRNSDEAFKQQQLCVDVYQAAAIHLGIAPDKLATKKRNCDTMQEMEKVVSIPKPQPAKIARLMVTKPTKVVLPDKGGKWTFKKLEVNDVIAIKVNTIDANFISIPGTSVGFRLLHVVTIDIKSRQLEGCYYRGGVYGLVLDTSLIKINDVKDPDILWVWSLDDDEAPKDFVMTTEFIDNVKEALDIIAID
jgi:hypothetical protein